MRELRKLLRLADLYLLTDEEKRTLNDSDMFKSIDEQRKNTSDFEQLSIAQNFSRHAFSLWLNEESESIKYITDYIEGDKSFPCEAILGFVAAWVNSDIQHPKVEELVKHVLKHDLLKFSLNMSVIDYLDKTKIKIPHRKKNDVFSCLNSLMGFFETRTINATADLVGNGNRQKVRNELKRLIGEDAEIGQLIEKDFKYYGVIESLHKKWRIKHPDNQGFRRATK